MGVSLSSNLAASTLAGFAWLPWVLLAAVSSLPAGVETEDVREEKVRLQLVGKVRDHHRIADAAEVLNAAAIHLQKHFGEKLERPLTLRVYLNISDAPEGAFVRPGHLRAFYDPKVDQAEVAYFFPTHAAFLRSVIHELAHQYHYRVAAMVQERWPPVVRSRVYAEGLAEVLADMVWDAEAGRLIAEEPGHWPAEALHSFATRYGGDLGRLVCSTESSPDYAAARAWVSFLMACHPGLYKPWSERLNAGATPVAAWGDTIREAGMWEHDFKASFLAYAEAQQERMRREQGYEYATERWHPRGEGAFCSESPLAAEGVMIPVDQTLPMRHRFEFEDGRMVGVGYVFNYENPSNYDTVKVLWSGAVHHDTMRDGKLNQMPNVLGFVDGLDWETNWTIGLREQGGEVIFSAAGQDVVTFEQKPGTKVGLVLAGGRGTFVPLDDEPR